jgi:glycosyltransferase involved in cell wall biosynthesis
MSHGNLAGLLARMATPGDPALVWSIRQSIYDLGYEKRSTARLIRLSAKLSGRPQAIVYNSHIARAQHEALGFSSRRGAVIPNGFDVSEFAPSGDDRLSFRRELGIADDVPLVGIVGRFHPMKDHRTFINAAKTVRKQHPRCRLILVGPGIDPSNKELSSYLQDAGLADAAHLLGIRYDMSRINAALDVAVSSSFTEAFPTAIGEAMSCGVPCVVTDVGDSGRLVGDTGIVVPPRDPEQLASGIARLLDLPRQDRELLGAKARARVISEYSLSDVVASFSSLYLSLVKGGA